MGGGRFDPKDWATYSTTRSAMSASAIFTKSSIDKDLDPKDIKFRESCDSADNPNSTPLIVAVDVTGSMGILAEEIVKKGLGVIMQEIYDRKPIVDPHIMCMAIGDANYDRAPLQVTQFEASMVITDQIEKIFVERGGGGNMGESYTLPWYFTAFHTKCDSQTKRKKKGYLFTIGDECPIPLTKAQIKQFIGDDAECDFSPEELLTLLKPNWNVFHLMVKPVSHQPVVSTWTGLLGDRAISLESHEGMAEVIVSLIQIAEGADKTAVAASWSGDKSLVVQKAIKDVTTTSPGVGGGVARL